MVLYSRHGSLSRNSGYDLIARHLDADEISAPRGDPSSIIARTAARVLRRGAASAWYQGSSAKIELQALARLRKVRPPILHYLWADMDVGYLPPMVRRISPGTRLVGTLHNPPFMLDHPVMRRPSVLRHFDALVLMSRHQADYLTRLGMDPRRLHVIPHGVDTDCFHPPGAGERGAGFTALSVGGYLRDFDLLQAVCEAAPELSFEIIGPGGFAKRFETLQNVSYRHGLTDDELAQAYRRASCLLLTVEDATANNSLLEAMASGLPVVGEAIGGIPDYAMPEFSRLCPPKSLDALVESLRGLARDPSGLDAMGKAARRHAETLSWPNVARQTRDLYQTLA